MELNEGQQRAVTTNTGNQLILAGAGTGKTLTIVEKVAHLLSTDVPPAHILCLTFSNEAAREMRDRIHHRTGQAGVHVSTFHSFCFDVVKRFYREIGYQSEPGLMSTEEIAVLLFKELGCTAYRADLYAKSILNAKDKHLRKEDYQNYLAELKERLGDGDPAQIARTCRDTLRAYQELSAQEQREQRDDRKDAKERLDLCDEILEYEEMLKGWDLLDGYLREKNLIDYPDMLGHAIHLLRAHGADALPDSITHLIIDEYQDTSRIQFEILKELANGVEHVSAVGDQNQSIYAFRGAYTDTVGAFQTEFTVEEPIPLDKSFRSTGHILNVAHALICHNYADPASCLLVQPHDGNAGEPVTFKEFPTGFDEADWTARKILERNAGGVPFDDIAILVRSHHQAKAFVDALQRYDVPFEATSATSLFETRETKVVLTYLSLISTLESPAPIADQAWWRLFHFSQHMSASDRARLGLYVKERKKSLHEVLTSDEELPLSEHGKETVARVKKILDELSEMRSLDVLDIVAAIVERTGLNRWHAKNREGMLHIRDLLLFVEQFQEKHSRDLTDFLSHIEILQQVKQNPDLTTLRIPNAVQIMTIHAAKGLEFHTVFLTNLSRDRFPITRAGKSLLIPDMLNEELADLFAEEDDPKRREKAIKERNRELRLAEERRLCYVAITRAKRRLFLTRAESYQDKEKGVSQFLHDIGYPFEDASDIVVDESEHETPAPAEGSAAEVVNRLKDQIGEKLSLNDVTGAMETFGVLYGMLQKRKDVVEDLRRAANEADPSAILDESIEEVAKAIDRHIRFSVSSIKTYADCPKQYELKHVLQMPDLTRSEGDAASVGSFLHEVFEEAAKRKIGSREELQSVAVEVLPEYEGIELSDCEEMLDVFWERHGAVLSDVQSTEEYFIIEEDGRQFSGRIDRIDRTGDGLEVIDYKTGKYEPDARERAWQLGLYAKAVEKLKGEKPRFLTLELLQHEKPRRFELQGDGKYKMPRIEIDTDAAFTELQEYAKQIQEGLVKGFEPSKDDGPCERCGYRFFCPKWG